MLSSYELEKLEPMTERGSACVASKPDMAGADQAADWPRLAEAWGSLRRALRRLLSAPEPAGRSLCHRVFDRGQRQHEHS
eukprot:scaffold34268_cov55-Phaeocystis_antarctica.AAC.1